jgi:nitrite reductase/ring-hydroxylating ferredoxin subunit
MNQLQGAPWLLAHRSMLKPNQPQKISLLGQDYVMWQDTQGNVSALPNACPHMGAMLSAGWCVSQASGKSAVVCPFHALEFDATGCTVLPGSQKRTQSGLHSHAYLSQPRKPPKFRDILKNPAQLALPKVLKAHLENFFPSMGLLHGEDKLLSLKECHFYLPEAEQRSRVFVLMYMQAHSPIAHLIKGNLLKLIDVVVEQDAKILGQIYANTPQKIKLNNEIGMDWVRRNFANFPNVVEPNLSRQGGLG